MNMAHLSSSAIFSPSVARQQLAAAKDWNYVDNWLSTKFNGKTPPPLERNNDTLKALLALAAANESADEESELLTRLEAKSLQSLQTQEELDANTHIIKPIEESLTREGQASLDVLSTLSVALKQPIPDIEKLGRSIVDLQIVFNGLEQTSDRISILEAHLSSELQSINSMIKELQSDAYSPPSNVAKQTVDYQRQIKILTSTLSELKDRISPNSGAGLKVTIPDVKHEEDRFRELLIVVKGLEAEMKIFQGLPQDTDLARLELETLRADVRDLTRQRDSMFEGLVERASPKKPRT